MPDKLNHVDYRWYVVRTKRHQEGKLVELLEKQKAQTKNILEIYAPTHTTVNVHQDSDDRQKPLFAGIVFVLATQNALMSFMKEHSKDADIQYERKKEKGERTRMCVIPESQMRAFRDYNENYADKVIVLERPYSDYAFNTKTGEPNEIVRVVDGPLAGCEGYICRFRHGKRLVFQVQGFEPGSWLTVSCPKAWDLHVVRLHNMEGDRLSVGTEKGRAVDLLAGILQACGYGERTLQMFYGIIDRLVVKPSLVSLCKELHAHGDTALSQRLARMTGTEAELVINLVRYEHDNPGYVKANWDKLALRPFLTPTAGVEMEEGKTGVKFHHKDFTEIIRKVDIKEEAYLPSLQKDETITTTYYAHIGMMEDKDKEESTYFANWDGFLQEYFLTAGKANEKLVAGTVEAVPDGAANAEREKLIESFRNYAPTLYKVLTDADSAVKAIQDFKVGEDTLGVLAIRSSAQEKDAAKDKLIQTCVRICKEINTTNHLAIWRRYLRTVWLHN
ncbi:MULTISPECIES: transcription termination/antitermination NusG family protein [Bacteroides]|uniref:transcription termination/antitermination NusG family protein n=1 Tax=Bacteroides TaxID=816 RepID=UPI000B39A552|nr:MULTISPECIES: transcription termination/antitermination NusG family protein [Bacteroides]MBM6946803.1 antitermination protein NusG [Bacteroides gallinaceum]OUO51521.1 antitermination protein NusG [Bacteroides sp. An279]